MKENIYLFKSKVDSIKIRNMTQNEYNEIGSEMGLCGIDRIDYPMKKESKKDWEKDNWCVSIVAEAMTFSKVEPIGKDASHITKKLRAKVSKAIASAVEERESKLSESVEKMKKARPTGAECVNHPESAAWDEVCVIHNNALDQVLSIINPSKE